MVTPPTILVGFVRGELRYEKSLPEENSADTYFSFLQNWFLLNATPDALERGVTHLQKRSRFGFLIAWPFCVHVWIMVVLQKENMPGSERGLYVRSPGFRWAAGAGVYVRTKGYAGLHWD